MNILETVKKYEEQMLVERRYLHEHPEISGQETQTAEYVAAQLNALGMSVHVVPFGGVIGVLNGNKEGPCVLLRADIDALPIQESSENLKGARSVASQNPGVMHACGHDAHTAMLLCAARVLSGMKDELAGSILFVFERGEEIGGKGFIENLLPYIEEKFSVDVCYATHVRWDIPAGRMLVLDGPVMAGAFGFDVTIHGRGGHGSRPDLACSPIDCFCAIHQQANALRMRVVDPEQVLSYSLGIVKAGEQKNIIPDSLRFAGTVRTYDVAGSGERFAADLRRIIDSACAVHGCTAEYHAFTRPIYETRNHPQAAQLARQAIERHVGKETLTSGTRWMATESMSAYLRLWPGVLSFTGIRNDALGCGANHHTPQFDVDEAALAPGAAAACAFAVEYLSSRPEMDFRRDIVSMQDLVTRCL